MLNMILINIRDFALAILNYERYHHIGASFTALPSDIFIDLFLRALCHAS